MVSVIIPVYNTGQYLRPCIESICQQTFSDLQIIIIDDGSEINTAQLCDSLATKDSRIEVVHKLNEGVSIARNLGLTRARGEYISFVDSDDTIHPDMIKTLVTAMEKDESDVAMCDAVTKNPGQPDEEDTIPDFSESTLILRENISPDTLTRLAGSAWRCVYRRTATLLDTGAHFPKGVKFSEDRIFNIMAMAGAKKISYIKQPFYNRLIRQGSACFRYYPDMTEQIEKMRKVLLEQVKRLWGDSYLPEYERQISGQIRYAVTNYTALNNKESSSAKLHKLKNLCQNNSIKECLQNSESKDIRSIMILHNMHISLLIIGIATNLYHKLCKR